MKGFCKFGNDCAYNHQEQSTILTRKNNVEINMKVEKLEKMVNEMAEKIESLESKVKEIESKDVKRVKEAVKKVEDPKSVLIKKDKQKNPQEKPSKEKKC